MLKQMYALDKQESTRTHLGVSYLGNDCTRAIWYQYNNYKKTDSIDHLYRLFQTGNLHESRLINDLIKCGYIVKDRQRRVKYKDTNLAGSIDGIITINETDYLLEIKTHNEKSFKSLVKKNVEQSHNTHYSQMQVYMKLLGLKSAVYLAVNKNNDELYFENVIYKEEVAKKLINKAKIILILDKPPERIAPAKIGSSWYQCKMCAYRETCYFEENKIENGTSANNK